MPIISDSPFDNLNDVGSLFSHNPKRKNKTSVPYSPPTNLIHNEDREAMDVIRPDMERGPWVAGGAPLSWYNKMPLEAGDVDIFCNSLKQAKEVIKRLEATNRASQHYKTDNATTFRYGSYKNFTRVAPAVPSITMQMDKDWHLQVITKRFYKSAQEVLDNFDISVCQIVMDHNTLLLGETTARDIREKKLRFVNYREDSVKRLSKYWTYGYRPAEGTLENIRTMFNKDYEFSMDDDYDF
jgi:hypothetical protein